MFRERVYVTMIASLIFASACDRCDKTTLSVDPQTPIAELSDDERRSVCGYFNALSGRLLIELLEGPMKHRGCFMSAEIALLYDDEFDEDGEKRCQEVYDACMAEGSSGGRRSWGDACPPGDAFLTCRATVGEYRACVEDSMEALFASASRLSEFTCADLQSEEGQARIEAALDRADDAHEPDEVASCRLLRERCPGVLPPLELEEDTVPGFDPGSDDDWNDDWNDPGAEDRPQ